MKLKIVLIALAFLLPTVFVRAEDGLTPCFDYYKFGSVQVDISPVNKDTLAGTNLVFQGNIRNTNTYPIVDGAVYVKIFRKAAQSNVQSNGWELVDQFFAQKEIYVDGLKQAPLSFTWKTPAYAVSGEYKVATYFVTQDRFNLSGLSFTDDITGTIIPFKITGEQTKTILFDKSSVKINDQQFLFAAFTPKVTRDEDVQVIFNLKNEYTTPKNAEVTYTLYSWDGLRNEKILNTKKEKLAFTANETKSLSYTVTDKSYPVYYLVVESKVDDVKSIINVRFARSGIEEARLNFPALANYPLKAGTEATIFSCFHNSGVGGPVSDGKVVMTLTDGKGKQLDTYTWEGAITGKMMGIKKSFTPAKDYTNAILITDLYVNNKLIDSSRSYYDCEKLNQEVCSAEAMSTVNTTSRTMMYIVIGLAVLVLVVAILAYHGHLKRKDVGVVALLFASTIGLGMYQVNAQLVSAEIFGTATTTPTLTYPAKNVQGSYIYDAEENDNALAIEASGDLGLGSSGETKTIKVQVCGKGCRTVDREISVQGSIGYINVDNFVFQYTYGAEMRNAITNAVIPEGAVIPAGTRVKFVPVPFSNNHIGWFLTGSTLDSPYAYWDNGGLTPACFLSDKFARQRFANGNELWSGNQNDAVRTFRGYDRGYEPTFDISISAYLPMVVTKPNVTVALDPVGTTANVTENTQDGTYTVNSQGIIKGIVTFAPTTAKAYFQYRTQNYLNVGILPMLQNGVYVDIAPGQESKVNTVPFSSCKTLTNFEFPLEQQQITLSADVGNPINKNPNAPGLTLSGTCVNAPTNIQISPASPVDPDSGDTVTYEYQVDYGSGYGAIQTTANVGTSVTFTVTGQKKVRVRAKDNAGATSAWVEKTISISNCATVSVYCSEAVLKGSNYPEWTATISNPSNSAYSISWAGQPSVPYTTTGTAGSIFTYQRSVGSSETVAGPSVTATIGSDSDTVQCPPASRGGSSSTSISGSCVVDTFSGFIPTWRASMKNGRGTQTVAWYKGSNVISGQTGYTYTNPTKLNPGDAVNDVYAEITASNGSTGKMLCSAARVSNTPFVNLTLEDDKSTAQTKKLIVQKDALAFANTTSNAVTGCTPTKTKKGGGTYVTWGTAATGGFGGLASLKDYPLLTSETGEFELRVTCKDAADNPLFSTSTLIITEAPNYEEF